MDNRSEILLCALRLFASRGYDAVGVQEIVDDAGVTKPTLYHYFGSKRGLLQTLLTESFQELSRVVASAAVYSGDLPLTLVKVAGTYFEFAHRHPLFYRLQLALWFAPPDSEGFRAVSALNHEQQLILEKLFERAAEDHGNMRGRHRAYAATFLGMVNTHIGLMLNGYLQLDEGLPHRVVQQYMYGIFS
jgi:AcrR family transcriptional regulator